MAVSVHEAKTNLSKYLAGVKNGLEIVIAPGKKLVAMTISKVAGRGSRVAGRGSREFWVPFLRSG